MFRKQIALAAVCGAAITGAGASALAAVDTGRTDTARVPAVADGRVVIRGCPAEDSCRIDFRPSDRGPVWIVRRVDR
jgi:hypothetical protein